MSRVFILIAIILAAVWLAYIAHEYTPDNINITLNAAPVEAAQSETEPQTETEPETAVLQEEPLYGFISFVSEHVLDIDAVLQMPDYPTGCETVSLSMALNYFTGEQVNIDILIDDYLPMDDYDFTQGFIGNPRSSDGGGCFPSVIVKCANKFLDDNHISLTAEDVSGITVNKIFATIDAGFPVLMWTTMHLEEPQHTNHVVQHDGITYQWYISEHCVLVKGYDSEKNVFIINDPLEGETEYDIGKFMEISDFIGNLAVIIQ